MKRIVMTASLLLGCFLYPTNALSDDFYEKGSLECSESDVQAVNNKSLSTYEYMVTEEFVNPVTKKSIKEANNYTAYYWPVDGNGRPVMAYYENGVNKGKAKLCDYYNQSCGLGIWESEGLSLKAVQEDCRFGSNCVEPPLYHTGQDYVFEYRYGDQKNIVRQNGGRLGRLNPFFSLITFRNRHCYFTTSFQKPMSIYIYSYQ